MRRVQEVEKGSFTPLVFSTSEGYAAEVGKVLDKAARKICQKHKKCYAESVSFIREKTRFSLLRSTLVALWGTKRRVVRGHVDCGRCIFSRKVLYWCCMGAVTIWVFGGLFTHARCQKRFTKTALTVLANSKFICHLSALTKHPDFNADRVVLLLYCCIRCEMHTVHAARITMSTTPSVVPKEDTLS
eukprot:sb/3471333/